MHSATPSGHPWHEGVVDRVGVVYHPRHPEAFALAQAIGARLEELQVAHWTSSAFDDGPFTALLPATDLIVSVGGDGTILKTARSVLPTPIPILGVNYGKVGFMAELAPTEVLHELPLLLAGQGWLEERAMLAAWAETGETGGDAPRSPARAAHALNDVVVARAAVGRPIGVSVHLDGEIIATYRCDAVIVATATGSTGYSLSAGGPILPPESDAILLTPVSAHLSLSNAIVLPPTSTITLTVATDHVAALSVDGQSDVMLSDGQQVVVRQSPYRTRFLRHRPRSYFYRALRYHLSPHADPLWSEGDLR